MARYRAIHCLIWNDDKFPFISDDCQLVFFHILSTPLSSPFGLYKTSIEALAAEKRWPLRRYRRAFDEAIQAGFVQYDERALVIYLPNFLKYNFPQSPNVLRSWGKVFEEIPNCKLKDLCLQQLKAFAEGFGKAFAKAFREAFREAFAKALPIQEQEQEQEQEQDKNPPLTPPTEVGDEGKSKIQKTTEEVIALWNATMGGRLTATPARQRAIKRCLKLDPSWPEKFLQAIQIVPAIDDSGWAEGRISFDWMTRTRTSGGDINLTVDRILAGTYRTKEERRAAQMAREGPRPAYLEAYHPDEGGSPIPPPEVRSKLKEIIK